MPLASRDSKHLRAMARPTFVASSNLSMSVPESFGVSIVGTFFRNSYIIAAPPRPAKAIDVTTAVARPKHVTP